jgi:capsular exopolysaccharide synthesis family protein
VARVRAESIQRASVAEFPATLSNSTIVGLETRVLQIEQDLTTLRGTFGENWPAVVQRRSDLALAHDQLRREKESALARAREQAAIDLKTAEDRRELEATSLKGQEGVVHQIEAASVEYNIVLREVETNKKQYERLLERVQQTSVTSGMEFAGIHVIEPAMPSSEVYSPRVRWLLSLASLLGVGLGVCVAFGRSYWDQSLRSVEDVEHSVALPMLGVVPVVRKAKAVGTRSSGKLLREARSDAASGLSILGADAEPRLADASDKFTEGVRTVCASLLLSRSGRPPRVLLVTSTAGGEGKSTLAFELACMLAQSGARTLLVDCDLRRPRLHRALGLDNEKGLSLFLSGHLGKVAPVRDVADNLFAVTAGPESPNPPALLGSDGMRRFLGQMTETHQFVILDSPPLMPVADARVLATLVEGVVFVIRAGVAPKSLVRRSRAMLEAIGAPVLGAVLNGADPDHSHLGYGYESYGHSN